MTDETHMTSSQNNQLSLEMIETRCTLCGSSNDKLLFEKEGFRHVCCQTCGLVYVNPRLKFHKDFQTVSGTGSMGDDQLSRLQILRICKELSMLDNYRKLNRILEIGPGKGWFLSIAKLVGWETWAMEINLDAIENLKRKNINNIITSGSVISGSGHESFDVIRMWDVIEHLEWPRALLEEIFNSLRSGGLLRLSTTNINSLSRMVNGPEWVYLNGSDHIVLFDPVTIDKLLKLVGFRRIRIRTRSFNLRRKLYHPEREIKVKFHPLRPFRKIIDETIKFTNFGHQMIVDAVKEA